MNPVTSPPRGDANEEVSALIEVLHQTGHRLEELTAGEVDTVADRDGRTFLLPGAQEQLRHSDAAKQAAILNALPAHIALLDTQGTIVSINEAWRRFDSANVIQGRGYGIGLNYLEICDAARGDHSSEAHQVADGIRSVLAGVEKAFSIEYPCHSPTEKCWFLLIVTPLADDHPHGAVVMHLNITGQKEAENRIRRLNRVYAVLSGINALIVRVRDRDELFREACRIAVDAGAFRMAWIGVINPQTLDGKVVAWAGGEEGYLDEIRLTARDGTPDSGQPASRALRQLQPVICNDTATDRAVAGIRDDLLGRGHKSVGWFPLTVTGRPEAVIALYAGESEFFDDEETRLLLQLAGDISFALDHIEKEEKLNYLAYYDVLTGLANRSLFLERVTQCMRSADSGGHKLALCMIDLERFKIINDSLGRPAGDALLRQVTEWLTRNAGDASVLARVGADHFAVIVPDVKQAADAGRLLDTMMDAFLDHPFRLNDAAFRIAAKVGIALFPDDGASANTLFENAEAALKKAKARGERYLFYRQEMTETVAGQLTLENHLRQALGNGEFVLHYQPKVNLEGKLTSAEALIRWNDPRTGLVQPDGFISILEETGLIHEVGRWALRTAVEDYLRWRRAGLAVVRIAVNVSPLQLRKSGFIAEFGQAIGMDAHAAGGLELEITESLIMEDVKHSIASLQAIRAMGVRIAIDDFGTGFSSLSYLSRLPLDTLKIDRSFVTSMTVSPEGLALVSTIIDLAHALKLEVVAEGVETEEQSRLLRLLNCDEMQGSLFSTPLPREIFEARYLALPRAA